MLFLKYLKAPPALPPIEDKAKVKRLYSHYRVRIMLSLIIGYGVFYFCRKNLSAATPGLIKDLGYTKTQIGAIWSVLYLVYGFSKVINGILGDKMNARYFMAIGLFVSAFMNIFFGLSSSLVVLGIFWAFNGWFQGMGWPPCARLLAFWYSRNERGTIWGIWNTSHQFGGAIILILAGYLTENYGWRYSFFIPPIIAFVVVGFLVFALRDTPESLGLPAIEDYRNDHLLGEKTLAKEVRKESGWELFVEHVLKNPQVWLLSWANFFVYIVRYGAMDWAPTFLVERKFSSIAHASYKTAVLEFAGVIGTFLAGLASDRIFKGRRAPVNIICMILLGVAVFELWVIPPGHPILDSLALGAIGFFVYGPQMLVSVGAADAASKYAVGSATGFTGLLGYLGSILSGVGTGWIVDHYGWDGGFLFFLVCAAIGVALFIVTWFGEKKYCVKR